MFEISEGFWENFEVSAIFFVLDVIIISLLLPITLNIFEERRWKSMRDGLVDDLLNIYGSAVRDFGGICFERLISIEKEREYRFDRIERKCDEFSDKCVRFTRTFEIFSFCVSPKMSQHLAALFNSLEAQNRYIRQESLYHGLEDFGNAEEIAKETRSLLADGVTAAVSAAMQAETHVLRLVSSSKPREGSWAAAWKQDLESESGATVRIARSLSDKLLAASDHAQTH